MATRTKFMEKSSTLLRSHGFLGIAYSAIVVLRAGMLSIVVLQAIVVQVLVLKFGVLQVAVC
jgi:hypothetical protein